MPWTIVTQDWAAFVDRLCAWFPYFDRAALRRFRGDRQKLVTYLADSHDLTEAEASEQLDHWFAVQGRAIREEAASAA